MEVSNDICDVTISDKFQEPRKKFWLRSRKRPKSDAMSVSSMDISVSSQMDKRKKRRKISEVASSIFSSTSKLNKTIAVDSSFSETENPKSKKKIRLSSNINSTIRSWMLDVAELDIVSNLSRREIKRQEAIYELFCGENLLLNDLCILRDFFYEPLLSTDIFTSEEMITIFGDINKLIQKHGKLRDEMVELRDRSGFTHCIGPTIVQWLSQLTDLYVERCRSQVWARYILDTKKFTCKRFQEFVKKKSETLRSVDLWTCLDAARSRIVKYPLLVNEILRHTPPNHADEATLKRGKELLSEILIKVDESMGEAECNLAKTRINIRPDYDVNSLIENATDLITQGQLKDTKGIKYYCFLFNTCFAITSSNRRAGRKYNLCFPVIAQQSINLLVSPNKSASSFKLEDHIFFTNDEHQRKHWIDSFKKLKENSVDIVINVKAPIDETAHIKEKENKPEVSDALNKSEFIAGSKNVTRDGYFTISLRKKLLRQRRNSTENTS